MEKGSFTIWLKHRKSGGHTSPYNPKGHACVAAPISLSFNFRPANSDRYKCQQQRPVDYVNGTKVSPDIKNIPEVANCVNECLCARQPRVGSANPKATPLRRAANSTRLVTMFVTCSAKLS